MKRGQISLMPPLPNYDLTVSSIKHSKFPLERASQTESPLHTLGECSFRLKELHLLGT